MKIKIWHEDMSYEDVANLAYWERNMLALHFADGWYNDDLYCIHEGLRNEIYVCPQCTKIPRYPKWRRVLTLARGRITFHIPDEFEVGNLPQVQPNWDGHTTEQKWKRIMVDRGIDENP